MKFLFFLCRVSAVSALRISHETIRAHSLGQAVETYAEYTECGGKTYLLSKINNKGDWINEMWHTRVRKLEGMNFTLVGEYPTAMSHNMAAICHEGQFLIMGGQYRPEQKQEHWHGIRWALTKDLMDLDKVVVQKSTIAVTAEGVPLGNPEGSDCIEGRKGFHACEFDGKVSVHKKGQRIFMYARANIAEGVRWSQVSYSDDLKAWSKMKPIAIDGLSKDSGKENVYFFHPQDWNSTHTAAVFPGVLSQGSGIWLTFSEDMINWSKPHLAKKLDAVHWVKEEGGSQVMDKPRVTEFPVALLNRRLLLMKRQEKGGKFDDAFTISDPITVNAKGEISTLSNKLNLRKWEYTIESNYRIQPAISK